MKNGYLKKMYLVLESGESRIRAQGEVLAERLERQGLEVRLLKQEENLWAAVPQAAALESDENGISGAAAEEGCLYLTDSSELVRTLHQAQAPVIAWLHEGNRGHCFGEIRYAAEEPEELDALFFEQIYRRYLGIPWTIAETERCLIRETIAEDAAAFAEIYKDPEITRYTESFSTEAEAEQETIREYIQKFYEFYGYGVWTVLWKESGEVIGRVGFEQPEAPALGYMIAGPWQGKGIATEVCRAALRVAQEELGFVEVQARIRRDNLASVRVAEKLGFVQKEGYAPEESSRPGAGQTQSAIQNQAADTLWIRRLTPV